MTLESAFQTLYQTINQLFLKECEVLDQVMIVNDKVSALDARIDYLEDGSAISRAVAKITTAPFFNSQGLNSSFIPSLNLFSNSINPIGAAAIDVVRLREEASIRSSYVAFIGGLDRFYLAYRNEIPAIESAVPFYQPDSAAAFCVSAASALLSESTIPVSLASSVYASYLSLISSLLIRFGGRDQLDVEFVVPDLFDVDGNLVDLTAPSSVARLVPKRAGFGNSGVARANIPFEAAWIGFVSSLSNYVEDLE